VLTGQAVSARTPRDEIGLSWSVEDIGGGWVAQWMTMGFIGIGAMPRAHPGLLAGPGLSAGADRRGRRLAFPGGPGVAHTGQEKPIS